MIDTGSTVTQKKKTRKSRIFSMSHMMNHLTQTKSGKEQEISTSPFLKVTMHMKIGSKKDQ